MRIPTAIVWDSYHRDLGSCRRLRLGHDQQYRENRPGVDGLLWHVDAVAFGGKVVDVFAVEVSAMLYGIVSGVMQINVQIPTGIRSGQPVSLLYSIGGNQSAGGVSVQMK